MLSGWSDGAIREFRKHGFAQVQANKKPLKINAYRVLKAGIDLAIRRAGQIGRKKIQGDDSMQFIPSRFT